MDDALEKYTDPKMMAAIHNAGHFVLGWKYGMAPSGLTRGGTALQAGGWDARPRDMVERADAALEAFLVCLFGGEAAVCLPMHPEDYLAANGMWQTLAANVETDGLAVAEICQTAAQFDRAFLTAYYTLQHYEDYLWEAIYYLSEVGKITTATARGLYARWTKDDYRPSEASISRCMEKVERMRQEAEQQPKPEGNGARMELLRGRRRRRR